MSCVLGERRDAVQPQVVAVHGASEARAQQAGGHTWRTQAKRSKVRVQLKLSGMASSEAPPHMLAVQDKTKSRLWKIYRDALILVTLLFNTDLACIVQAHQAHQVYQALAIQSSLSLLQCQHPPEGLLL